LKFVPLNQFNLTKTKWQKVMDSVRSHDGKSVENAPPRFKAWSLKHAHSHNFNEILVSLSGNHLYGIDGKTFAFVPGNFVLLPRQLPHDSVYGLHHAECIDFWIHFLPHNRVMLNFLHHIPGRDHISTPVPVPSVSILEDFKRVGTLLDSEQGQQKAQHFLTYLLYELFDVLMNADGKPQTMNVIPLIDSIKQYVTEHLTDRLSLSDLAGAAGYSPFHFHRIFLEAEGITPRNFVEGQRLKKACELLKAGYTMTSAAMDSGFSTSSQFARVFKRQFQLSPSGWLKSIP